MVVRLILAACVLSLATVTASAQSQWPQGSFLIKTDLNGKCLDVPNAQFKAGTALQTWQCWAPNPAQVFEFTPEHQIRIGGLCLNIFGGLGNNGDTVGLWQCVGAANEKWDLVDGHLVGMNGRCLDVYGGSRDNGAKIIVWDCAGRSSNQLWSVAAPEGVSIAAAKPSCPDCPPWVARSLTGNYLPLAAKAEVWSDPKPFLRQGGPLTVQSRFMGQHGTTCKFEVQFNNVGGKAIDERIIVARPGKAAVSQYDFPLRAKLAPGSSVAYATEVRECPLIWGKSQDMTKCASCDPMVYFVGQ